MHVFVTLFLVIGLSLCSLAEKVILKELKVEGNGWSDRQKRSGNFMPKNIRYQMVDSEGLVVMLNLTKLDLPTTYIVKGGRSTKFVGSGDDIATYKDAERDGVFMLERKDSSKGDNEYVLIGTFQFGQRQVSIRPEDNQESNLRSSGEYQLEDENSVIDFTGDAIHPPEYVPPTSQPTSNPNRIASLDAPSLFTSDYFVEVCFLADYAIYQKFLTKNGNDSMATITEMATYYAFRAEQLRVMYERIQLQDAPFSISIVNSGLVIYTDSNDIPFIESWTFKSTINSSLALSKFRTYISNIPAGIDIPPSDHYMLFSGYDLFSGSTGRRSNLGIAYVDVMCSSRPSVSVVEDNRNQLLDTVAAHELAHGLGVDHDADEGCSNYDQYIMAAQLDWTKLTSTTIAKRRWTFSSCSVDVLERKLLFKTCLSDNRYGNGVLSESPKLGQVYSKDQQCQFAFNDESSTYWSAPFGKECYKMKCTTFKENINATYYYKKYILPFDYTDCGTNSWCIHGECVSKINTPPRIINSSDFESNEIFLQSLQTGIIFDFDATDDENDTISFLVVNWQPNSGRYYFYLNSKDGTLIQKPGTSLPDDTSFTLIVRAFDGKEFSAPASVVINTPDINQGPVMITTSFTMTISTTETGVIGTFIATDADNDTLTYSPISFFPPTAGTMFVLNPTNGAVSVKWGAVLIRGIYTVSVIASDGRVNSTVGSFHIYVQEVRPINTGITLVNLPFLTVTGIIISIIHRKSI